MYTSTLISTDHQDQSEHAKKEIVALYKEIVEGTISDGWI